MAAEAEARLVDRLGEPEAYAAELRAAAGAEREPAPRRNWTSGLPPRWSRARRRLRALDAQARPAARATPLGQRLPPAAAPGLVGAARLPGGAGDRRDAPPEPARAAAPLGGSVLAGLFAARSPCSRSIWLGRRAAGLERWPRRWLQRGTAAAGLLVRLLVANVDDQASSDDYGSHQISVETAVRPVQDVFVYDSEGRLVGDARLFDQNGVPIRLG